MQHFKFGNWKIGEFVFWCYEQVSGLHNFRANNLSERILCRGHWPVFCFGEEWTLAIREQWTKIEIHIWKLLRKPRSVLNFIWSSDKSVICKFSIILLNSNLAVRSGKKSSGQETGLGNRRRQKDLNDTKRVLNEHEWHPLIKLYQFGIIHKLHMSPILKTSFLPWAFFPFLQQDDSRAHST